jgi:hypothetical protein
MPATGCRWRSLTHTQEAEVRRCVAGGGSPAALARLYDVSIRTIYRTLAREPLAVRTVQVGAYEAPFIVGEDGPIQMGPWVASRARAWDNGADEYSVPIAHNAQRPSARLYSGSEGVDVPEYRRNG